MTAAVSGRAGLFTMDNGRFFGDLRGTPYTNNSRQKSGAIRLEFGQYVIPDGSSVLASVKTTCMVGIMAVVTPTKLPTATIVARASPTSGQWFFATDSYSSGCLPITLSVTGEFSGQASGMTINYLVVGY